MGLLERLGFLVLPFTDGDVKQISKVCGMRIDENGI